MPAEKSQASGFVLALLGDPGPSGLDLIASEVPCRIGVSSILETISE